MKGLGAQPTEIHNAIAAVVEVYGAILEQQRQALLILQAQNQELQRQLQEKRTSEGSGR